MIYKDWDKRPSRADHNYRNLLWYSGDWVGDQRHGYGTQYWLEDNVMSYDGRYAPLFFFGKVHKMGGK